MRRIIMKAFWMFITSAPSLVIRLGVEKRSILEEGLDGIVLVLPQVTNVAHIPLHSVRDMRGISYCVAIVD